MAFFYLQITLTIFLLPAIATAIATTTYYKNQDLKSMHFTLYMQDILNVTDFMIYEGLGDQGFTPTAVAFGSIVVLKDPLTATPDPTSKRLGTIESMAVITSDEGLYSISVTKITLDLEGLRGSISLMGVVNHVERSDFPVAGGTGDFVFVQGYVTTYPNSFGTITSVYKNDFHLYWPPYAASLKRSTSETVAVAPS